MRERGPPFVANLCLFEAGDSIGFKHVFHLSHLDWPMTSIQDDDFPAHPNEVVTARSLKRAFERDGMTRANAEAYLGSLVGRKIEKLEVFGS